MADAASEAAVAVAEAGPPLLHIAADGVAQITLRRPQHLNRLHREDLLALQEHLRTLRAHPDARVLVLTGQGRAFCAGFNIAELQGPDDPRLFEHTVDALEALPLPTVARLNGSVYGGATDLVLACDLRVGLQGIEWRMPATALGLHFYPSGLRRYVSRFGVLATQRAFLTGRPFDTARLQALGLFEALCPPGDWDATVQALVQDVLALAPLAVQDTKRSIHEIACGDYDVQRLRERQRSSSASADFAEGRAAFAERRSPRFRGG